MHYTLLTLAAAITGTLALSIPGGTVSTSESSSLSIATPIDSHSSALAVRDVTPGCKNTAKNRQCWGDYNIDTNYYDEVFHTGRTVTYWLTLKEIDCAPDGYQRKCITANGTMPGPAIVANWGDDVVVHVTNNIANNGSAIHWHGLRQLNNTQYDGVPGVTQCPIAPGSTMTYKFHASQYGTSLYHSHFSLQYSMGLYGPIVINGPATANYDIDLGTIFLTDWDHQTAFDMWATKATFGLVSMNTGLINGMNTGVCTYSNDTAKDPHCISGGKKFELTFQEGKSHRLRLINIGTEAWFQFSIDQHNMQVIATDFVPITPYTTDGLLVNMGQRYDVIVTANATAGDYWMRGGFNTMCIDNAGAANITGIVRYDKTSTADPTSVSSVLPPDGSCMDEPADKLKPWVPIDLPNMDGGIDFLNATGELSTTNNTTYLRWGVNGESFMWVDWNSPALGNVKTGNTNAIPVSDNVFQVATKTSNVEYTVLVIEDLTPESDSSHPIHLHGHDFLVLATGDKQWDGSTANWQTDNPPRRDVATMPNQGYLVIAWALDNPGLWAIHCHIAWHSSGGFAAALLESQGKIASTGAFSDWSSVYHPTCAAWKKWKPKSKFIQDDSGI